MPWFKKRLRHCRIAVQGKNHGYVAKKHRVIVNTLGSNASANWRSDFARFKGVSYADMLNKKFTKLGKNEMVFQHQPSHECKARNGIKTCYGS